MAPLHVRHPSNFFESKYFTSDIKGNSRHSYKHMDAYPINSHTYPYEIKILAQINMKK